MTSTVDRDRGRIGTMIAPSSLDAQTRLDFVEGLRAFALGSADPVACEAATKRVTGLHGPKRPMNGRDAAALLDPVPAVGMRNRLLRSAQEMIWSGVQEAYASREGELLAWLEASRGRGPGTLTLPEDFELPDYLVDYHLQPGGYHAHPLAGFIYHYGTKVFWLGTNDRDQQKIRIVDELPVPTDGRIDRLLDLACSVGQSTTALKDRFPVADVYGIDVAAPLLRYAHARAVELDSEVHYVQMAAEELNFEDDSMDLVYASILFHEVPVEAGERIVAEAARVLRPRGLLVVNDLGHLPAPAADVYADYAAYWDSKFNGEPYEYPYRCSDFDQVLRRNFTNVVSHDTSPVTTRWDCTR